MTFTRFGPDAAETWSEAATSSRVRWVAFGIAVAGIVAGFAGIDEMADTVCSPAAPCTDLDVDSFGVFLGLLGLSLLGLWLWPVAGAVLGVMAALVDLVHDPSSPARLAFAAYALSCVAILLQFRRGRRQQADVLKDVPRQPVEPVAPPLLASGRGVWMPGLLAGAAVAALALVASLGAFALAKETDAAHRSRAVRVTGQVVSGSDDDLRQRVAVDQAGLPTHLWVTATSELPRGSQVRFLVDPSDPSWTELPFDPADHSYWLTLAIFAGGLALGAGALVAARRWAAVRQRSDGLDVEVAVSAGGLVLIRAVGGSSAVATFLSGPPAKSASGRRGRRVDWTAGLVVGDFRDRGWVQVRTDRGLITPGTPLRATSVEDRTAGDGRGPDLLAFPSRGRNRSRRLRSLGRASWALMGLGLAALGAMSIPDAMVVAQGGGVPGTLTITSESCGKSCSYTGDFRSDEGSYAFRDVWFSGSGAVGSIQPAVYLGNGQVPDEVYQPGAHDLVESGLIALLGLGFAGAYMFAIARDYRPSARGSDGVRSAAAS